ncbi:MAG: S49 family peptidase, partial [Rhodospirillales bacterium]|nr:S49 family peptidase [Rhodospirillales bacterium]
MRRFLARVLAVIGGLVVFAALGAAGTGAYFWWTKPRVPAVAVLTLDLDRGLPERRDEGPLSLLRRSDAMTFRQTIDTLDHAATDPRVKGLVAAIGAGRLGLAQTQELRDAIRRFRAAGKFAYAVSDSFGEFGPGNAGYYLAAAFDRIYLQPTGALGLTGFYAEVPFARDALDQWNIQPRIDRREAYKTAPNTVTETGFTPEQRENLQALIDDLTQQAVRDIAQDRRLEPAALRTLIDRGPFDAGQAKQAGLVDELAYRDQALDAARGKAGGEAKLQKLQRYAATADRPKPKGDAVALVYAVGAIMRGDGGQASPLGRSALGAARIAKAIEDATADKKVKAIVLRIDSP